jgi:pimeloyl-ACP methyl ester carboxylesterase
MFRRKAAVGGFGAVSKIGVTVFLLALVGCATPVGVRKVSHEKAYQTLTASILSGEELSEPTVQVLNRAGLDEAYKDAPADTIADLHRKLPAGRDNDLLYALAELSFRQGERSGEGAYFLSAAVYAYAFLFPNAPNETPDAFDPRFRTAVDLYNQGLIRGFTARPSGTITLKSGRYRLPFGQLIVTIDPDDFLYGHYRLVDFADASQLIPRGLRNRYRWPGIGGPLVAGLQTTEVAQEEEFARVPPSLRVAVTAVLHLDNVEEGLRTGQLTGGLSLYTKEEATAVSIEGRQVALEYAQTAALAATLEGARVYSLELKGLLTGDFTLIRESTRYNDNIFFMAPYEPGKIPVVFVHGTASSPARWAEMLNELSNDRELWGHYQFWFFAYNTGNPILYSSGLLTAALRNVVQEFDPAGTDPALKRMVVIGHSQGGLLTKLTVVDSGTRFWDNALKVPIEDIDATPETIALLRQSLVYTPLPFVEEVIFISTPHRGSFIAGGRIGRLASALISLPFRILSPLSDLLEQQPEIMSLGSVDEIPRSTDNMDPTNKFIQTIAEIPIAPGVKAHSIIAVNNLEDPKEEWNDGVVAYQSAHIEGAASELIVASGHSAQENPLAIEEVRRILREHLKTP